MCTYMHSLPEKYYRDYKTNEVIYIPWNVKGKCKRLKTLFELRDTIIKESGSISCVFQIFIVDHVYSRHCPAQWTYRCTETFARSIQERALVRYRLSRYSQPANLKSEQGNLLLGFPLPAPFVLDRCGVLSPVSPVYLPVDRRLVLYVFFRVDKLDAIASLFAKNFLGKYIASEPLNIEEVGHRDPLSLPFGQGLFDRTEVEPLVAFVWRWRFKERSDTIAAVMSE